MKPVDESFFQTAPQRFAHSWEISRPADSVWTELTGDKPLCWCNGLSITWTSPAPFGVGTTRTSTVLGLIKVQERYFLWEEGRRKAFYGAAMNLPLLTSLAEDYLLEPRGENACRFTWRIAVAPSPLGKRGAPVNKLLFEQAFRDTSRHFRAG